MAITQTRQDRRDDSPAFNPKMFYTLNNLNLPNYTLSAGIYTDTSGATNLTTLGSYSSENWQLFFQSGRYFIRNYDYGANWQLGLTEDSRSVPKLYPRSGSISQQWTLNKVNGGWEMVNELWGEGTVFALPKNWPNPAMRSEADGRVWNITSNPSAAEMKPITGDMLKNVDGFQVISSTMSMALTTSVPTSTPTNSLPQLSLTSDSALSRTTTSPPDTLTSSPSSASLSGGAIAGIAIGAIVLLATIIFGLWFFLVKRKRLAYQGDAPHEVHGTPMVVEKYAYNRAELASPPAELASGGKETVHHRVELDSGSVSQDSQR